MNKKISIGLRFSTIVFLFLVAGLFTSATQSRITDTGISSASEVNGSNAIFTTATVQGAGALGWTRQSYEAVIDLIGVTCYSWKNDGSLIYSGLNITQCFQDTIDTLQDALGGTIFISEGTYYFDDGEIYINTSASTQISIKGANKHETALVFYNSDGIVLRDSASAQTNNEVFESFTMFGNSSRSDTAFKSSTNGVFWSDGTFRDLYVTNWGTAFDVKGAIGTDFRNVRVKDCTVGWNVTVKAGSSINFLVWDKVETYGGDRGLILHGTGGNCNLNYISSFDGGDSAIAPFDILDCDNSILDNSYSETNLGRDLILDGERWKVRTGVNFDNVSIGTRSQTKDVEISGLGLQGLHQNWTIGTYASNVKVDFGTTFPTLGAANFHDQGNSTVVEYYDEANNKRVHRTGGSHLDNVNTINATGTIRAEHFDSSDDAQIDDDLTVGGNLNILQQAGAAGGVAYNSGFFGGIIYQLDDGLHFYSYAVDGYQNNNFIFMDVTNRIRDCDHETLSPNPTVFMQSSTDCNTDNTEWLSFSHNTTDAKIVAGKGAVSLDPEARVEGIAGDGSGKAVCIKADGNLGTCTDAVGVGGTCTCT